MLARFVLIAAATLVSAKALAADAPKPAPRPEQTQATQPKVVLASADQVRVPSSTEQHAPAVKRPRVARVTTCRCADLPPQPDE